MPIVITGVSSRGEPAVINFLRTITDSTALEALPADMIDMLDRMDEPLELPLGHSPIV